MMGDAEGGAQTARDGAVGSAARQLHIFFLSLFLPSDFLSESLSLCAISLLTDRLFVCVLYSIKTNEFPLFSRNKPTASASLKTCVWSG